MSHQAAPTNKTSNGNRQEALMSPAETGPPGAHGEVELVAFIKTAAAYSNGLGAAGTGGGLAFSTRAIRFERAIAGFCHSRSTSFIASSIRNRTRPLVWSTQPTLRNASASAARISASALARSAARLA